MSKSPFSLPNLPKLRFKGFDDEYQNFKINDLFEFISGLSGLDNQNFNNGTDRYIEYKEIYNKRKLYDDDGKLFNLNNSNQNQIITNDILITSTSETIEEIGFSSIYLGNKVKYLNSFCFAIRSLKNFIFPEYINCLFSNNIYRKKIISLGQGSTRINMSKNEFGKILINFPSLQEQQKIAKFFSLIDKQIELWETKLKLNEQKEKYYQNLFLYDANLFSLNIVKIMDIFDIKRGNVLNTRNVSTNKDSFFQYPVYSSQTLHNGLMGYYNEYLFEKCITWTTDGANAGNVTYREEKFYCTNVSGVLIKKTNTNIFPDLCKAIIINKMCKKFVSTQLGNPKLMNNTMGNVSIEIPDENLSKILSSFFKKFLDNKNNINLVISILTKRKIFYFSNIFN